MLTNIYSTRIFWFVTNEFWFKFEQNVCEPHGFWFTAQLVLQIEGRSCCGRRETQKLSTLATLVEAVVWLAQLCSISTDFIIFLPTASIY